MFSARRWARAVVTWLPHTKCVDTQSTSLPPVQSQSSNLRADPDSSRDEPLSASHHSHHSCSNYSLLLLLLLLLLPWFSAAARCGFRLTVRSHIFFNIPVYQSRNNRSQVSIRQPRRLRASSRYLVSWSASRQ